MDNYMAITCGKKNKPKKQTIKNMQTIKKLLLTLVALAALSAGAAAQTVTWNNETWADLTSTYMEHSFTVGDITLSHTGDEYQGFKRSESSGDPLYFYVSGSDLTFTSNGAPFTRIDMEMVNEYSTYNPAIQPLDGWTFDGQHAVWEGNAQSVTMTQCTTRVDQIVFTLSNPLMTLNASRDTATLLMPNADMTVSYELVRDIEVQTLFVGVPEEPVAVTKSGEQFVFASGEAPTVLLLDLVNQNAPIVDGATYSFEKQNPETGDFEASNVNLLADAQPGTWRIVVTATDDGHYTGTAKSQPFTLYDIYQLTIQPADEFSAGKLQSVTVGEQALQPVPDTVRVSAEPGTQVVLTAQRGYVFAEADAPAVAYPLLSAATTEDVGKVVCAAGHLHDAKTAVPNGCTAVGIIGKVTETGHGLILALQDATPNLWYTIKNWTSVTTYAGTTLRVLPDDAARGSLTSYTTLGETTVSNWAVAQKSDYEAIFTNLGSTTGDDDGKTYDANVNAYITTGVGGTAISGGYCSATDNGNNGAWLFLKDYWDRTAANSHNIRPVLGF